MSCYNESETIEHIRGDTFSLTCTRQTNDETPLPIDITNTNISCWGKRGDFVFEFDVIKLEPENGIFRVYASAAETRTWPITTKMECDIEYEDGGNVNSTGTFYIKVVRDISNTD